MLDHVVAIRLPDGRHAVASYLDPIVVAMRRVNACIGEGKPGRDEDYAEVAAWLDGQAAGQLELPFAEAA
jgi:hypothetical protein